MKFFSVVLLAYLALCRELSLRISLSLSLCDFCCAAEAHNHVWLSMLANTMTPPSRIPAPFTVFPTDPLHYLLYASAAKRSSHRYRVPLCYDTHSIKPHWSTWDVCVCVYVWVCVCLCMCVCESLCMHRDNSEHERQSWAKPFLTQPQQQRSTPYSPLLLLFFLFVPLTYLKEEHKAHPLIVRIILSGILVIEIIGNARMCHLATDL